MKGHSTSKKGRNGIYRFYKESGKKARNNNK